jgi:CelD/BcsL family acetyltransferase involved in cellulose biosynthesis
MLRSAGIWQDGSPVVIVGRLRLEILNSVENIVARRSEWDACIKANCADIYFTVDWLVPWWEVYGEHLEFVGAIVWDDASGSIIAALTFAIDSFGPSFHPLRVARLAGVDPNYAILALPVLEEFAGDVWKLVLAHLFSAARCACVSISPISDQDDLHAPFLPIITDTDICAVRNSADRNHTIMELPDRVEDLYTGLSKGRQREYRRSRNRMERSYRIERTISDENSILEDFERFSDLHRRQWQTQGKGGHFSDWPESAAFLRAVVARLAPLGRGLIENVTGDGDLLASRITFQLGERVYWRLTARTLDPVAQSIGVARVALLDWAGAAAMRGGKLIEAGAGEYDHKLAYGGQSVPLRRLILAPRHTASEVAVALVLFDLLDLLYYRIWFLKLAPRLRKVTGMRPRPLWRIWRRTRL